MHRVLASLLLAIPLAGLARRVVAQESPARTPRIDVVKTVEEGETILLATVTVGSEPVEGVEVAIYVKRTFGLLLLGEEETLDDGTAAVAFPKDLPGGPDGVLAIVAKTAASVELAAGRGDTSVAGARVVAPHDDAFPRALWAPKAPLGLLLAITLCIGGVWCTYLFVVVQILRIRREASA